MNRRHMLALVAMSLAVACQNNTTAAPVQAVTDPSGAVATVNGRPITAAELLAKVDYQMAKNALNDVVEEKLIADAASKAGKSTEQFLKAEVDDKLTQPTDTEVKDFYEQHKERMGGRSFDDVKNDLRQSLAQQREFSVKSALTSKLRAAADVKISLEPPRVKVEGGDNPSRGPKGAPVEVVEWTDYQCPFCGRARPTVNQIISTYGDKVHYVIRDFPLSFHKNSFKAHEAAHCAGDQGKYWEMNQTLFANQQALEEDKLKEYAKTANLDVGKFERCLSSGKYKNKVEENMKAGSSVGVTGTPAFFVNGVMLSGARPFNEFKDLIDADLAKAK